jgi:hypothetical protein
VKLNLIGAQRGWLRRRFMRNQAPDFALTTASPVAASLAEGVLAAIEERAWWGRYGL